MNGGVLYFRPASIVQRFKAAILDAGLLLSVLIAVSGIYYAIAGVPEGSLRYVPPHPDMGLWRVVRPLALFSVSALWLSAFLASKWRATPGMMAMQIRMDCRTGGRVRIGRAFGWLLAGWAPLLLATTLVLAGIHLQFPLLHAGRLNLFSALLIAQCLWFSAILIRTDRHAVHDLLAGVSLTHYADRRPGLALALLSAPFYAAVLPILGGTLFASAVNLFDAPTHPRLADIRADMPDSGRSLYRSWRADPSVALHDPPPDFRCASRKSRFHAGLDCASSSGFPQRMDDATVLADFERATMRRADVPISGRYSSSAGLPLVNALLAGIVHQIESDPLATRPFENWLHLTGRWRAELLAPASLHSKSALLMNYNRTLSALPVLLAARPSLLESYGDRIDRALAPVPPDAVPVDSLIGHEYRFYDMILQQAQLDYLPFAQPAHTRNQFVRAAEHLEFLLSSPADSTALRRAGHWLAPLDGITLYNPLGMRMRDLALANLASNLHVVTTFHHHNALKKMLRLYVEARREGTLPQDMDSFLASLPHEKRIAIGDSPVRFDPRTITLYYEVPGLHGFRRELGI